MKGHGHFNPDGPYVINKRDKTTSREHFLNELKIVEKRAILLIRNPYHVIYSYRNYVENGLIGHADELHFLGTGKS